MHNVKTLFLNLPSGEQRLPYHSGLLRRQFFEDFPRTTPKPSKEEQDLQEREGLLQQVELKGMYIKWATENTYGEEFFQALANMEDLTIFNNKTLQSIIDYKWDFYRWQILLHMFLPFVLLKYIPVFVLCLNAQDSLESIPVDGESVLIEHSELDWIQIICIIALLISVANYFRLEFKQLMYEKLAYFKSFINFVEFLTEALVLTLIGAILIAVVAGHNQDFTCTSLTDSSISFSAHDNHDDYDMSEFNCIINYGQTDYIDEAGCKFITYFLVYHLNFNHLMSSN